MFLENMSTYEGTHTSVFELLVSSVLTKVSKPDDGTLTLNGKGTGKGINWFLYVMQKCSHWSETGTLSAVVPVLFHAI